MSNESNPNQKPAGNNKEIPHEGHDTQHAPAQKPIAPRLAITGLIIVLLVFAALGTFGVLSRIHHNNVLAKTTQEAAAPVVIALVPKAGASTDEFTLPGNVTAYTDSPIYARTSGYLTKWYYDIGSHVKKGALLAEIATPELDQQLTQAQADLGTAEANAKNAHSQAQRYQGLVQTNAVSQQDTETFTNQASATASAVKSAQANVDRLKELQSFEKVYAPFDGVVTARSIDTGQLIDTGAAKELFHLQALNTLRVYTNVPQLYTTNLKRGSKIDLTFPEYPAQNFQGTLVRTADAIDPSSRTLLVEIDVDNHKGELMPGSLAQVHFKAPTMHTFIVPASAIIFRRQGTQLGILGDDNIAHLVSVAIGQDDGATIQIVSGLKDGDRVIQDPPDSLIDGEKVSTQHPNAQGQQKQPGQGDK
ncbi:efflux RND transporter periplasmic adaptor subunit [Telmatobacter sp. DSM 110680]|uniref:Efflux RND transporter periplasmic adaptor subunit n=1 Tax=Telmatobacter sp. DSM 110680 TaxID=3036704 RepID=A0AAU7DKW1_9BACT